MRVRAGWAVLLLLVGCQEAVEDGGSEEGCLTTREYFAQEVWAPLMSKTCIACHNPQGAAKATKLILQASSWPGYLDANLETVRNVASYEYDGTPLILLKPTGRISHGGGQVIALDSPEYAALAGLVDRLGKPETCVHEGGADAAFYDDVTLLGPTATFRRAAVALGGRLPTPGEEAWLEVNGEAGLETLVDALLDEDAFYERLMVTYNDELLTDKYVPGDDAGNLLSGDDWPDRKWWKDDAYAASASAKQAGKQHGGASIAREPLELIAHVVREGRPFTEVLTADYTMVNPLSARSYGVFAKGKFTSEADPDEWREVKLPGVPHAGVLTSPMFLNRHPTTDTNRNRHRSRTIYDVFLATDILALGTRPIDPTGISDHNPTMFNSNCTVCHALMDPVAGAFMNWSAQGRFAPPEMGWYPDMRPPGFGDETIPMDEHPKALQWLATRFSADERFATATVRMAYRMLTGLEPLREPTADDETLTGPEELDARRRAWLTQSAELDGVRQALVDSGFDFKAAVKALVLSPAFRAAGAADDVLVDRAWELSAVGGGRLLPPEVLATKIAAATGFPWREQPDGADVLLATNRYRLLYGGIDSDQVIDRIDGPNGLIAAIGVRMANEMACLATARDFSQPPALRRLFPYAEVAFEPEDDNGFAVPAAEEAIRRNIRYLHSHLLGEVLADGSPELEATVALWESVWRDGRAAVESGAEDGHLSWQCQSTKDWWTGAKLPDARIVDHDDHYTVRAWTAVVAYMLSDYRFLFDQVTP